ncbi:MAG: N-acetylmuramoyl-L-alanine amidase [Alphaproteobacteria bacterium]|nr:N-acetylmuramoyl-L-alanine amidase [Alphaproteobacteria bacterium]
MLQPGVSRIVFDTERPTALKTAFVLPAQNGSTPRLVIDFSAASDAEFRAERSKVLGTLDVAPAFLKAPARVVTGSENRLAGSTANAPKPPAKPNTSAPRTPAIKPLIIIDPGHGGTDPGAKGANGVNEKQVTLALSQELRDQLIATGRYRAILTRDKDVFIKLGDRVKFARKHEGDLFISLHADSINKPNVGGASVYTLSDKASDEQTAKLAARENQADLIGGIDLSTEDEDVANILVDLAMRDTMNQSRFFAGSVVDTLAYHGVRILERPHRYAGFAVLKAPDIPSILVEAGFMSNRQEANLLSSPQHRQKIAAALVRGVDTYFQTVNGEE